jgi:protein-S-isoprenylcysteine O-methyltransferase Ste14
MNFLRHLLGYIIGFSLFCILFPYLLLLGSPNQDLLLALNVITNFNAGSIIALSILCTGLLFAVWSNIFLVYKGMGGPTDVLNVAISPRSKKLVVTGPYRYCRNPMVFGMLSVYISISVFLHSLLDLIILSLVIPIVILYLKLTEEKRLIRDFGEEFLSYRSKVPMIVPFTKIRKKINPGPTMPARSK